MTEGQRKRLAEQMFGRLLNTRVQNTQNKGLSKETKKKISLRIEKYYQKIVSDLIDEYDPLTENGVMISIGVICKI